MKITIFSTPTCPYCKSAKEFLRRHNIGFKEVDVSSNEKAAEYIRNKTGSFGVPQIELKESEDDEGIYFVGFDDNTKKELKKILKLKG